MADLVTHLASVLIPGAFVGGRLVPVIALGVLLPDVAGRVIPLGLEVVAGVVPVPDLLMWPWGALHTPIGIVLLCGFAACAVIDEQRRDVFWALVAGGAAHLAVDLLQDHHGHGYYLFGPFHLGRYELGWMGSEASITYALPLLCVAGLLWGGRMIRRTSVSSSDNRDPDNGQT